MTFSDEQKALAIYITTFFGLSRIKVDEIALGLEKPSKNKGFRTHEILEKFGIRHFFPERASSPFKNLSLELALQNSDVNMKNAMTFVKNHFARKSWQEKVFSELVGKSYFLANRLARRYMKSLLARHFVILTGNSGTGKTKMAVELASLYSVGGGDNRLIIPVGADWTDNTKMLGYYNPITEGGKGAYIDSEVLKFIQRALEDPENPYFLILDEMNLSHVERYFSDFLSQMELVGSDAHAGFLCEGRKDKNFIEYPQNLFVTGTVNIDETTHMFSPKVLDRAFVVEFAPEKNDIFKLLSDDWDENKERKILEDDFYGEAAALFCSVSMASYKATLKKDVIKFIKPRLEAIYEILKEGNFEFSYRVAKDIKRYIWISLQFKEADYATLLDELLLQKILPKIHGNKIVVGPLLNKLKLLCDEEQLRDSSKKIEAMLSKLNVYQYTSFI